MPKKKLKDINIPIKMKIQNLTKELIPREKKYSWENPTNVSFYGNIYLEVYGEKLKIGDIMTWEYYKTMPELMKSIKEMFLAHLRHFHFDIRG